MKITLKLIIILQFLTIMFCSAQKYNTYKDEKGKQVIVGKISWKEWQDSSGWKDFLAEGYYITQEQKAELSFLITDSIEFVLFAGSWCGDSESEVPIIYKIMNDIGFSDNKIELVGVDRQKKDIEGDAEKYEIVRVPTLVILKDKKEIGRIVEFPKKSWCDDIIEILR